MTAPQAAHLKPVLEVLKGHLTELAELYAEVEQLAYAAERGANEKVRVAGGDPTGEMATGYEHEDGRPTAAAGARDALEQVAWCVERIGARTEEATKCLRAALRAGHPDIKTRGVKRWTTEEARAAETRAAERVRQEDRVVRRWPGSRFRNVAVGRVS